MKKKIIKIEKSIIVEEEMYIINFEELEIIHQTISQSYTTHICHSNEFLKLYKEITNLIK